MLSYWYGKDKHSFEASIDTLIVGTFIIKDNFPGLGSHVANALYMILPSCSGQGVGMAMGVYSLKKAAQLGYKAMQFNIVVKSNQSAIRLWGKPGFEIKGGVLDPFDHQLNGLTDAYIMWRKL
jgi:ribosomal protein S18 acetylase RimI-like enzyme